MIKNLMLMLERVICKIFSVFSVLYKNKKNIYVFHSPYGLSDNSYYLMKHYLELGHNCCWVYTNVSPDYKGDNGNLIFVRAKSFKLYSILLRSKYIFVTHSYKTITRFIPSNLIIINLWHGAIMKKMGYDSQVDNHISKLWFNPYDRYDYFISASQNNIKYMISCLNINKNKILALGQPRTDILYKSRLNKYNSEMLIFLYAPTFRDKGDPYEIYRSLCTHFFINNDNNMLIIRFHPKERHLYKKLKDEFPDIVISKCDDPQDDLLRTSVLVSDYSSIVFDFLVTNKRVILYIPDFEFYFQTRDGFYFDYLDVLSECDIHYNISNVCFLYKEKSINYKASKLFNIPNSSNRIYTRFNN